MVSTIEAVRTIAIGESKNVTVRVKVHNCRIISIEISGDVDAKSRGVLEELLRLLYTCSTELCIEEGFKSIEWRVGESLGGLWSGLKEALKELLLNACRRSA